MKKDTETKMSFKEFVYCWYRETYLLAKYRLKNIALRLRDYWVGMMGFILLLVFIVLLGPLDLVWLFVLFLFSPFMSIYSILENKKQALEHYKLRKINQEDSDEK